MTAGTRLNFKYMCLQRASTYVSQKPLPRAVRIAGLNRLIGGIGNGTSAAANGKSCIFEEAGRLWRWRRPLLVYFVYSYFMQTLNNAAPKIAADLNGMALYSWSVSIPSLGLAVGTILAGKLSDIYGRRAIMLGSTFVFHSGHGIECAEPDFRDFDRRPHPSLPGSGSGRTALLCSCRRHVLGGAAQQMDRPAECAVRRSGAVRPHAERMDGGHVELASYFLVESCRCFFCASCSRTACLPSYREPLTKSMCSAPS